MNTDTINKFKQNFENLKKNHLNLENVLKKELSNDIQSMVEKGLFDESQLALSAMKELMNDIQFEFDFQKIERSIHEFDNTINTLKVNTNLNPVNHDKNKVHVSTQVKNLKQNKTYSDKNHLDNKTKHLQANLENALKNNHYNILKSEPNKLQVKKENHNLYLHIIDKELDSKQFLDLLETHNEKKNIGFALKNSLELKKAKMLSLEWSKQKAEHELKFLTIKFTSPEILKRNSGEIFEIQRF